VEIFTFRCERRYYSIVHDTCLKVIQNISLEAQQNPLLFLKNIYICPQNTSGNEVLEIYNDSKNYLATFT